MKKIVIFGVGENAEIAHYLIEQSDKGRVVAFTVDRQFMQSDHFRDLPVVPFDEIEKKYLPADNLMFIAIGYSKVNKHREEKYNLAKEKGYSFYSYISERATLFDNVKIGDNCFILEDNTIQPFVEIGNNVVLWSGNHIGHHSIIEDNVFITSHVVVSGGVTIGRNCFIGVNATLRDHIKIAPECVVGAGALILNDTEEKGVYIAQEAEKIRATSDRLRRI